jgi:hypothetical protein
MCDEFKSYLDVSTLFSGLSGQNIKQMLLLSHFVDNVCTCVIRVNQHNTKFLLVFMFLGNFEGAILLKSIIRMHMYSEISS